MFKMEIITYNGDQTKYFETIEAATNKFVRIAQENNLIAGDWMGAQGEALLSCIVKYKDTQSFLPEEGENMMTVVLSQLYDFDKETKASESLPYKSDPPRSFLPTYQKTLGKMKSLHPNFEFDI